LTANSSRHIQVAGAGVTVCVVLASTHYGWDRHVWDLTPAKILAGRQVSFAAQALFVTATGLAKISIFVSYLRIAPLASGFRRLICESTSCWLGFLLIQVPSV